MVRGLALLALLALDIPPGDPPRKGCSQPADPALILLSAAGLLAAPLLLRTRKPEGHRLPAGRTEPAIDPA